MKIKTFILSAIALTFYSCEPLDETPFSSISENNIYQNEKDVDIALMGVYSSLNIGIDDLWYLLSTSGPGESIVIRLKGDGTQGRLSSMNFIAQDGQMHAWWTNFYRGINRSNTIIANIPSAGLEPELEDQKIAEARFLRGFFYFNLVKRYGGVPLHLEATTDFSDESVKKPRATIEEVYEVIIEDLKYSETRLPPEWDAANKGRATSGAGNALLGKVYLNMAGKPLEQEDKYSLAVEKLSEVVQSGEYVLQDNFENIFANDNEFNSEIIFARPNIREEGAGTSLNFWAGVPNSPYTIVSQYQFGFTEKFYNSFSSRDKRRDITLLYSYIDKEGREVTYNDPNNPPLLFDYADPNGIGFGKVIDSGNQTSLMTYNSDIIYIRFADVLLMLAEGLNEIGQSNEALIYLNMVRDRAGLENIATTDKNQLLEIIKQERKWELAGEYQEYPDLQRWGDIEKSLSNNEDAIFYGATYDPKMELMAIPQSQLDANENLEQNPGY